MAFGASLVGLELHTQDFAGDALDVIDGLGNLDATTLTTATGVDLGLNDPHGATEFLCSFYRLLYGKGRNATRNGHTKLTQDFLALVFVNLHEV